MTLSQGTFSGVGESGTHYIFDYRFLFPVSLYLYLATRRFYKGCLESESGFFFHNASSAWCPTLIAPPLICPERERDTTGVIHKANYTTTSRPSLRPDPALPLCFFFLDGCSARRQDSLTILKTPSSMTPSTTTHPPPHSIVMKNPVRRPSPLHPPQRRGGNLLPPPPFSPQKKKCSVIT